MEIRRLRAEEWKRWRAMRLELLRDAPEAFGSTYEETLASPDTWFQEHVRSAATSDDRAIFVAEDDGTWLACAGGYVEPDDGEVWIFTVWTRPEARGRGLQRALVGAVMTWARRRGHSTIKLWVTDDNIAAQACYASLGFTPAGVTKVLRGELTESVLVRSL